MHTSLKQQNSTKHKGIKMPLKQFKNYHKSPPQKSVTKNHNLKLPGGTISMMWGLLMKMPISSIPTILKIAF